MLILIPCVCAADVNEPFGSERSSATEHDLSSGVVVLDFNLAGGHEAGERVLDRAFAHPAELHKPADFRPGVTAVVVGEVRDLDEHQQIGLSSARPSPNQRFSLFTQARSPMWQGCERGSSYLRAEGLCSSRAYGRRRHAGIRSESR